jgi:hypothetical protein
MTFSIATLSITGQAECHYAGCHDLFIVMLNVIMLSFIMLHVIILSVVVHKNDRKNFKKCLSNNILGFGFVLLLLFGYLNGF